MKQSSWPFEQLRSVMSAIRTLTTRQLGLVDYTAAWHDMQGFTDDRGDNTPDELWFLEHPPVFTLGRNGKQEHLRDTGAIPVIRVDRGGQVTYHGPGQLIAYILMDIKRRRLSVQSLVRTLEQAGGELIDCQVYTQHLESLGARLISRSRFQEILRRAVASPGGVDWIQLREQQMPIGVQS